MTRQYNDQAPQDEITARLSLPEWKATDPESDVADVPGPPSPPVVPAGEPLPTLEPAETGRKAGSTFEGGHRPSESAEAAVRPVVLPPLPPVISAVDETPTPTYLSAVAPPGGAQGRQGRGVGLSVAALIFSLLALAMTGLLTWRLSYVGQGTLALLDGAIGQLESVCGQGAKPFTFVFSETVRFKGEVPLPEGLVFPFKGNIPINTVVRIEVAGFPGTPTLEIPINTTVPIDTKVPVPGGIKIPIDTAVPVHQEIPINLCGDDSPLAGFLGRAIEELRSLRDLMRFP